MTSSRIGIIVPTVGTRGALLRECLTSIRASGSCYVCIIAVDAVATQHELDEQLFDNIIQDPGKGLAAAINIGVASLPSSIKYVNWIGDDDLPDPV